MTAVSKESIVWLKELIGPSWSFSGQLATMFKKPDCCWTNMVYLPVNQL